MFCPNCGAQNGAGVATCSDCGRPLPGPLGAATSTAAPAPQEPPRILRRPGPLQPPSVELPVTDPRKAAPLPPPNITAPPGPMPPPTSAPTKAPTFSDTTQPLPAMAQTVPSASPLSSSTAEVTDRVPAFAKPAPSPLPPTPAPLAPALRMPPVAPVVTPSPQVLPSPPPPAPTTAPLPTPSLMATLAPPPAPQAGPVPALPRHHAEVTEPVRVRPPPPAAAEAAPAPAPAKEPAKEPTKKPEPTTTTTAATATQKVARPGPAPVVRLEIVGFLQQWGAAAIDGVVGAAVVFGALRAGLAAVEVKASPQGVVDTIHTTPMTLVPVVAAVVGAVFVLQLVPVILKGSIGQRLLRSRLVDRDGQKPGVARLLLRAVFGVVTTLFFFAGPAWGLLVDGKRRGLHDVVAGTVAVRI